MKDSTPRNTLWPGSTSRWQAPRAEVRISITLPIFDTTWSLWRLFEDGNGHDKGVSKADHVPYSLVHPP
jgi:hypothetical protein